MEPLRWIRRVAAPYRRHIMLVLAPITLSAAFGWMIGHGHMRLRPDGTVHWYTPNPSATSLPSRGATYEFLPAESYTPQPDSRPSISVGDASNATSGHASDLEVVEGAVLPTPTQRGTSAPTSVAVGGVTDPTSDPATVPSVQQAARPTASGDGQPGPSSTLTSVPVVPRPTVTPRPPAPPAPPPANAAAPPAMVPSTSQPALATAVPTVPPTPIPPTERPVLSTPPPAATAVPAPTNVLELPTVPVPTAAPPPTTAPQPTATPLPTTVEAPTMAAPTTVPEPTAAPVPTMAPLPTTAPEPTTEPHPTEDSRPTAKPEPTRKPDTPHP